MYVHVMRALPHLRGQHERVHHRAHVSARARGIHAAHCRAQLRDDGAVVVGHRRLGRAQQVRQACACACVLCVSERVCWLEVTAEEATSQCVRTSPHPCFAFPVLPTSPHPKRVQTSHTHVALKNSLSSFVNSLAPLTPHPPKPVSGFEFTFCTHPSR